MKEQNPKNYVLAGYLRFIHSDEPGVVAEVISKYAPGHAHDTDVPIFTVRNPGSGPLTKAEWEAQGCEEE